MMHFTDDLLESSLKNSPFKSLELCYFGSTLEFSTKNNRLLQTYFGRKKEDLFWQVWNEHLQLDGIETLAESKFFYYKIVAFFGMFFFCFNSRDLQNGPLLTIVESHKKFFIMFDEKKKFVIEKLK